MKKKEFDTLYLLPNTWCIMFTLKHTKDYYFLDCESLFTDFPYAKELNFTIDDFQNIEIHKTKLSGLNDKIDICIDTLLENAIYLYKIL